MRRCDDWGAVQSDPTGLARTCAVDASSRLQAMAVRKQGTSLVSRTSDRRNTIHAPTPQAIMKSTVCESAVSLARLREIVRPGMGRNGLRARMTGARDGWIVPVLSRFPLAKERVTVGFIVRFNIRIGATSMSAIVEEGADSMLKLEIESLMFYSQLDEDAFFSRLSKTLGVVSVEGFLRTINIYVDTSVVDEYSVRELISLFQRYGIGMHQLRELETEEFTAWMRNRSAYWYKSMYGSAL